MSIFRFAYSVA